MRVLVADNDPDALDLAVLDLGLEGHEIVATAPDGDTAVAACRAHRPDVLVVDYRMPPGLDGVAVAEAVLREGLAGRVIVYSNYGDPAVVARARRAGASWLRKGDLSALRRAVVVNEHP